MIELFGKILTILPLLISSVIALIQIVIKTVKELVTAVMNICFPFFPDGGKFETTILKIRDKINSFELVFENIKNVILKIVGVKTT